MGGCTFTLLAKGRMQMQGKMSVRLGGPLARHWNDADDMKV